MVIVSGQSPQERDSATVQAGKAAVLAQWEVGLAGVHWLDELAGAGLAEQLAGGGYPSRWTARAGDVLPLLDDGAPTHGGDGSGFNFQPRAVVLHPDRIAACSPDHVATIDVWDLS